MSETLPSARSLRHRPSSPRQPPRSAESRGRVRAKVPRSAADTKLMMSHKSSSHRAFTPGRILAAAAILALGLPAFASLVVLQDSRTLQVRSFRVENDEAVVELSTGGWMRFPSEMVRGVAENGAWEPPPPRPPPHPPMRCRRLPTQTSTTMPPSRQMNLQLPTRRWNSSRTRSTAAIPPPRLCQQTRPRRSLRRNKSGRPVSPRSEPPTAS